MLLNRILSIKRLAAPIRSSFINFRNFSAAPEDKIRIINVTTNSIHKNLAYEDFLFHHDNLKYPTLMMWRNDKNIVIGKHQNPWKECHIQKMQADGISLCRRKSGGGAVYQDLGNTCFTFLHPIYDDTPPLNTKEYNNEIILSAMKNLGVDCELSGRNDITCNGKKFSGSAYEVDLGGRKKIKKALHHGTLLLDVDVTMLWNYLNPDKAKLKSKGITSVVSRVMNLIQVNPEITHDLVCEKFVEEFKKYFKGREVIQETIHDPVENNPKAQEIYEMFRSDEWLYGKTPDFTYHLENRFTWGNIDLYVEVENGVIINGTVYSDCLVPELIDCMVSELRSNSYNYRESGVRELMENIGNNLKILTNAEGTDAMLEDIRDWFIKAM